MLDRAEAKMIESGLAERPDYRDFAQLIGQDLGNARLTSNATVRGLEERGEAAEGLKGHTLYLRRKVAYAK